MNDDLTTRAGLSNASEYQIAILDHIQKQIESEDPVTNLMVEAVAGSGKTTTIVAAARLIPKDLDAVFLSFNKSIAGELRTRLPEHVESRTLNSLGQKMVGKYLRGLNVPNVELNPNRTSQILRRTDYSPKIYSDVKFLVAQCKSYGLVPRGEQGVELTDDIIFDILRHNKRRLTGDKKEILRATHEVLKQSFSDEDISRHGIIDFDDQKWLTVTKTRPNGKPVVKPVYDVIFVDEVQDVNAVDIQLVASAVRKGGLVVGVGDRNQSIYGFRGADACAFQSFSDLFEATELPLSITYRCGSEIVKHAQELVPQIEPAPDAPAGEVKYYEEWDTSIFQPGDLVMCRKTTHLIKCAFEMINHKVPVVVLGREIGKNITNRVAEFTDLSGGVRDLPRALDAWKEREMHKIDDTDPDNDDARQKVKDIHKSIMIFVVNNRDNEFATLLDEIQSLFTDDDNIGDRVLCSTIHKAKGLEADRAFIYNPDCLYPKNIKKDTWQWDQEVNIDYVARTRAKHLLGYIPPLK